MCSWVRLLVVLLHPPGVQGPSQLRLTHAETVPATCPGQGASQPPELGTGADAGG